MIKVGVLGASGLVGSRLVEIFHLEKIAEVIPIVRDTSSLPRLARFQLEWRFADAMDLQKLTEAFRGCDVVIHAVHGPNDLIVNSPRVAYRAAQQAGVRRIVYLSTAAVHGQNPEPGTDESSPLHTRHPYSYNNAKVRAEREFRALRRKGSVELVILRPGIVFGPRDRWITNISRAIVDRTARTISGPGVCNTTYVDNLVHAIRLAMTAAVDDETFLIVDKELVTWRDLYVRMSKALSSDWEIPEVAEPRITHEHVALLDRLKELRGVAAVVPRIPRRWKHRARQAMNTLAAIKSMALDTRVRPARNPWKLLEPPSKPVSEETYLLYQCRHKFSYARALDRMNYEPLYSVDDGLRLTSAWLKFAEFPIQDADDDEASTSSRAAMRAM